MSADTFLCCATPIPWPTAQQDQACPECGTVWEREPVSLGAGARIKTVPPASPAGDPVTGPFQTERQAAELPEVRAIYGLMGSYTGRITDELRKAIDGASSRLITDACERAGVELGAYDARIVAWLGNWEPQTCAVIAGLISRAHAAGRDCAR